MRATVDKEAIHDVYKITVELLEGHCSNEDFGYVQSLVWFSLLVYWTLGYDEDVIELRSMLKSHHSETYPRERGDTHAMKLLDNLITPTVIDYPELVKSIPMITQKLDLAIPYHLEEIDIGRKANMIAIYYSRGVIGEEISVRDRPDRF